MTELPRFADLFFLPRLVDPDAQVSLEDNLLVIRTQKTSEVTEYFRGLPHVVATAFPGEQRVELAPRQASSLPVLVRWPNGTGYGAILWGDKHYTLVREETIVEMIAGGKHAAMVYAEEEDSFLAPLERYVQTVHA